MDGCIAHHIAPVDIFWGCVCGGGAGDGGGGGYHYENWSTTLMIVGTMVALQGVSKKRGPFLKLV